MAYIEYALVVALSLCIAALFRTRNKFKQLMLEYKILEDKLSLRAQMDMLESIIKQASDMNEGLQNLLDTSRQMFGAEGGIIFRLKDDTKELIAESYNDEHIKNICTIPQDSSFSCINDKGIYIASKCIKDNQHINILTASRSDIVFEQENMCVAIFIISEHEITIDSITEYQISLLRYVDHLCTLSIEIAKQKEFEILRVEKIESDELLRKTQERLDYEIEYKDKQREFIERMSHESRTPLAVINSSVFIVKRNINKLLPIEGEEKSVLLKALVNIESHVKILASMIETALKVAVAEIKGIGNTKEECDLKGAVHSTVERLKTLRHDVIIKVADHLVDEMSDTIVFDKENLQTVVENLISNAIKYSKSNTEILIELSRKDDLILMLVIDQGIGIPPEQIGEMFTKYFRGENTSHIKGTGIGLYYTKQILDLNDAKISVSSELDKGSEFMVSFQAYHKKQN